MTRRGSCRCHTEPRMEAHEIPELDPQPRDADGHGYTDFLASKELSVGLAIWPAGATDRQQPHREDEVYYVISGRGRSEEHTSELQSPCNLECRLLLEQQHVQPV